MKSHGWDPKLSLEKNKKRIRTAWIAQQNKGFSGPKQIRIRLAEYGGKEYAAGSDVKVDIYIKVQKGYYFYGIKEGDTYVNTKMNWELPEGFEFISNVWPEPKIKKEGEFETPYYDKDVHFRVKLKTPANAKPGDKFKINILTTFQYCNQEGCALGEANHELEFIAR